MTERVGAKHGTAVSPEVLERPSTSRGATSGLSAHGDDVIELPRREGGSGAAGSRPVGLGHLAAPEKSGALALPLFKKLTPEERAAAAQAQVAEWRLDPQEARTAAVLAHVEQAHKQGYLISLMELMAGHNARTLGAVESISQKFSGVIEGLNAALHSSQRHALETDEQRTRETIRQESAEELSTMVTRFQSDKATIALTENQAQHAKRLAALQKRHADELAEQARTNSARLTEAQSVLQGTLDNTAEQLKAQHKEIEKKLQEQIDAAQEGNTKNILIGLMAASNIAQATVGGGAVLTAIQVALSTGGPITIAVQKLMKNPAVQQLSGAFEVLKRAISREKPKRD